MRHDTTKMRERRKRCRPQRDVSSSLNGCLEREREGDWALFRGRWCFFILLFLLSCLPCSLFNIPLKRRRVTRAETFFVLKERMMKMSVSLFEGWRLLFLHAMHEASLHWEEDGVGRTNMRSSYAYAFFLLLWSEMPLACRVLTLSLSLWQDDWSECASSFPFSCICYLPSRVFFISSYEDKTQFVLWQRMTHSWDHCSSFLLKL